MKRSFSLFLAVLFLCLCVCTVFAAGDPSGGPEDPAELPDIAIVNYRRLIVVPEGATLDFNVTANAPDGYRIEWTNGYIENATEKMYTVSADLVRISDGAVVKSTKAETVYVLRGPVVRWFVEQVLALYAARFYATHPWGGLPIYFFIFYQDNRVGVDHYVGMWDA